MNDQRFYSLVELKEATDRIIEDVYDDRLAIHLDKVVCKDAVNWASLRCIEARESVNHKGERNFEVLIEEAAPDAYEFQQDVMRRLHDAGFHGIEVMTDW